MSRRTPPWLSRLHAALLALLLVGQIPPVGQAGSAILPAWQLAAICHANGADDPAPGVPSDQHHDHCALCLTISGPILFVSAVAPPMPTGFAEIASAMTGLSTPTALARRAHAPRAPPEIV